MTHPWLECVDSNNTTIYFVPGVNGNDGTCYNIMTTSEIVSWRGAMQQYLYFYDVDRGFYDRDVVVRREIVNWGCPGLLIFPSYEWLHGYKLALHLGWESGLISNTWIHIAHL